jgi:hypothetical protein
MSMENLNYWDYKSNILSASSYRPKTNSTNSFKKYTIKCQSLMNSEHILFDMDIFDTPEYVKGNVESKWLNEITNFINHRVSFIFTLLA